jgi:hypothetical protein
MTYVLLVCLISVGMAWHTWHSNPLYSLRSTVRFTVIVFLTLAAVLAAVGTTINLTKDASPTAAEAALLCVSAVSTLALIYAVIVGTSPSVPLPAGTPVLTTMRAKMTPWAIYTGFLVLVTAVLALAMPDDFKQFVLSLGGVLSFICIVFVFALYLQSLGYDRGLTAIELHPWVRWTYSPDEWKLHTQAQARDLQAIVPESGWRRYGNAVLLAGVAALIASFFFTGGTSAEKVYFTLAVLAVLGATFAATAVAHRHAPHQRRAFLIVTKNEACFGEQGYFIEGRFAPWISSGSIFEAASIDPTPPRSLILTFAQETIGTYGAFGGPYGDTARFGLGGGGSAQGMDRVLLPNSPPAILAADLERLERGLRATCPEADVNLR